MGGVSSARNVGIDRAKGEWIVFVDPDDRLEPFYLKTLYEAVAGSGAPLAVGGYKEYNPVADSWKDFIPKEIPQSNLVKDCYLILENVGLVNSSWTKIYNVAFLRSHNLRFDETLTLAEDAIFCLQLFYLIDKVAVVPDSGYRYIINPTSATNKYHANYKIAEEKYNNLNRGLLLRSGKTEDELEANYVRWAALHAFINLRNYFRQQNHLSFFQKSRLIKKDILSDKRLMSALRQHRSQWEGIKLTLCTQLLLTRQAWLVTAVFLPLLFMKEHFTGLFNWYDLHWGKLSKRKR